VYIFGVGSGVKITILTRLANLLTWLFFSSFLVLLDLIKEIERWINMYLLDKALTNNVDNNGRHKYTL